jgi:WD domain, G-beta repeat
MNLRSWNLLCAALFVYAASCARNNPDEHPVSVQISVPSARLKIIDEQGLGDALAVIASKADVSAGIPESLQDEFFNTVRTAAGFDELTADAAGKVQIKNLPLQDSLVARGDGSLWLVAASEAQDGRLVLDNQNVGGPHAINVAFAQRSVVPALTTAAQNAIKDRKYAQARLLAQSTRSKPLMTQINQSEANDLLTQGEEAFRLKDYDKAQALAKQADGVVSGLGRTKALMAKILEVIGGEVRSFAGHTGAVTSVALSPDGTQALSAGLDHTVKLWDVATGHEVRTFRGHRDAVTSVAFSPDGKLAASGSNDSTLRLWDVASGAELQSGGGLGWHVSSVAFSPDGKFLATAGDDNQVTLWTVPALRSVRSFTGHGWKVTSVTFSPDGNFSLSGSEDDSAKLWEVATGRDVQTFHNGLSAVTCVAYSPDGTQALSGGKDGGVKLWNLGNGHEVLAVRGDSKPVRSVAFSPDGRFAISGSDDGTLKLWDLATGKELRTFTGHTGPVASVVISPDGRFALSGGADGTVRLWQLPHTVQPAVQEAKK